MTYVTHFSILTLLLHKLIRYVIQTVNILFLPRLRLYKTLENLHRLTKYEKPFSRQMAVLMMSVLNPHIYPVVHYY